LSASACFIAAIAFDNFIIGRVSFDYEILPDGTCARLSSSGCGGAAVGGIYPNQPEPASLVLVRPLSCSGLPLPASIVSMFHPGCDAIDDLEAASIVD